MPFRRPDLLATPRGRRLLFGALYLSEGAPIGYIWWALPTRLREAGVPVSDVAQLAAILTLPWALKFLWAPLVDALRPRRLGLRAWIVGAQLAMGLTLLPVATLAPTAYDALMGFLLLHAICAATQDVAIDALAVGAIPEHDRGAMTGWMQLGMMLGRAVFGGVALRLEDVVGADRVVYAMIAVVLGSSGLALLAREAPAPAGAPRAFGARMRRFRATLLGVLRMPGTWLGFAIAVLAGAGIEAAGTIAGPLLIDRGVSKAAVGDFFTFGAVAFMVVGALAGGRLSDRVPRATALAGAIGCLTLSLFALAAASALPAETAVPWLLATLCVAYGLFGSFTACSYALYMDLTEPAVGGTQFSAYMGAVNLCSVWSAWAIGRLHHVFDYPLAIAALAAASLLALPLLWPLRRGVVRWREGLAG